jgi:hypothetical protein
MKNGLLFLSLLLATNAFGQIGGLSTYAFLNLPYSARSLALGTDFISAQDDDLNLGVSNPALYNKEMHQSIGFNQGLLAQGIMYGMLNYGKHYDKLGTLVGHLRYVDYGRMDRTDITGQTIGKLNASEYSLGLGLGREVSKVLTVGANLNLIYSQLDTYFSIGTSVDLAGKMYFEEHNLVFTALMKNVGYQWKSYTGSNRSSLPAEIQMAVAHKLKHAPFRFSLLAHHLNTWNLTYVDPSLKPTVDPLTGDTIPVPVSSFGEKLARHFTYQAEIILSKNIHIRAAFDYHHRQEMKVVSKPAMAGFSFGVGLNFKRLTVDYGLAIHSQAGYTNMLSLRSNIGLWKKGG